MAIKVSGTTVIDDSRNLKNITNLNNSGNMYANTFIGDGSQLTNLPPSGGTVTATASGTLSDGTIVVLNSDGTVSAVDGQSPSLATGVDFNTTYTDVRQLQDNVKEILVESLGSGKILIVYNGDDKLIGVVGSISGSTISFGSETLLATTGSSLRADMVKISSSKVALVYSGSSLSYSGYSQIVSISGSSVSAGTQYVFRSGSLYEGGMPKVTYDANADKIVVGVKGVLYTVYGEAYVGTVSGTAITWGSVSYFKNNSASWNLEDTGVAGMHYDSSNQKVIVIYADGSGYNAKVGTVSGTGGSATVSWGSESPIYQNGTSGSFLGRSGEFPSIFDEVSNKLFIFYTQSDDLVARVGSVSGTSISFGSDKITVLDSATYGNFVAGPGYPSVAIDPDTGHHHIFIGYSSYGATPAIYKMQYTTGSPGSYSVLFRKTITKESNEGINSNNERGMVWDSTNEKLVLTGELSSTVSGTSARVYTPYSSNFNSSKTNVLGISDGAYANGATATIQIAGSVDDAQSSLTPGSVHHVEVDGTLLTTASDTSQQIGTALSATKLLIKG